MDQQPKSNAGIWAAVGVAAVGIAAAAALGGGKKPTPALRGVGRKPLRFAKKPCGCGR